MHLGTPSTIMDSFFYSEDSRSPRIHDLLIDVGGLGDRQSSPKPVTLVVPAFPTLPSLQHQRTSSLHVAINRQVSTWIGLGYLNSFVPSIWSRFDSLLCRTHCRHTWSRLLSLYDNSSKVSAIAMARRALPAMRLTRVVYCFSSKLFRPELFVVESSRGRNDQRHVTGMHGYAAKKLQPH